MHGTSWLNNHIDMAVFRLPSPWVDRRFNLTRLAEVGRGASSFFAKQERSTDMKTSIGNTSHKAVLAASMLAMAGSALANTVTVTTTLDATQIQGGGGWTGSVRDVPAFSPSFDVQLAAGDTFDFRVMFEPGQQLTINNLHYIWLFSYSSGPSTEVTGTGHFSFLDASGNPLYTSITVTDTEGFVHFGQHYYAWVFDPLPASFTVSGLEYVGTLDSYSDPAVVIRNYNDPALYFNADSYSVSTTAVPEPEAYAMMMAGLGLLASVARRRQAG
jgi:hypothetical protein